VRLPDAGKMHFMHSDQQIFLGEDPDTPHGLHNFGARRVGLPDMVPSAPLSQKILATPLYRPMRFFDN